MMLIDIKIEGSLAARSTQGFAEPHVKIGDLAGGTLDATIYSQFMI